MSERDRLKKQLGSAEREIGYLKRALSRMQKQLARQEKIDDMNRHQTRWAMNKLDEARVQAEQASRAKSDFLANMSHEIRTPLNIVLGMGELLADTDLDSTQKHYLQSLRFSGQHLLKLIDDILEFSRIESGALKVESRPFNLKELLVGIEAIGTHLAVEKGIEFELECEPSMPMNRIGDSRKIKQVLFNLLHNAVKFTDSGTISLSVTDLRGYAGPSLLFIVSDTGIGIPDEKQPHIFDRFSQLEQEDLQTRRGVGLGLAISNRLVNAMGGQINLDSKVGSGSSFMVNLPVPIAAAEAAEDRHRIVVDPVSKLEPMHILVVDDIQLNFEVVQNYLGNFDVTCDYAENGRRAVALFRKHSYDAILMDIRMPVMSGSEAVRRIRRIEKVEKLAPLPIIAMTAQAFVDQESDYTAIGYDEVLIKPFSRQELLAALSRYTRQAGRRKSAVNGRAEVSSGADPLTPLIPRVLESTSAEIEGIRTALKRNDFKKVIEISHAMKGLAGMYGLKELSTLFGYLQKSAEKREQQTTRTLLEALHYRVRELRKHDHDNLGGLAN